MPIDQTNTFVETSKMRFSIHTLGMNLACLLKVPLSCIHIPALGSTVLLWILVSFDIHEITGPE